jgi:hypothetical protein
MFLQKIWLILGCLTKEARNTTLSEQDFTQPNSSPLRAGGDVDNFLACNSFLYYNKAIGNYA